MPDYSKGKVYKLVANETEDIYIGSTTQPLCERKALHVSNYKRHTEGRGGNYVTSHELLKHPSCRIELLEAYPCASKEELYAKEGEWIRRLPCVNKCIAGRGKKESDAAWREANYEKKQATDKAYYESHRESILERERLRYEKDKESEEGRARRLAWGRKASAKYKASHPLTEEQREKRKAYMKAYYAKKKDASASVVPPQKSS